MSHNKYENIDCDIIYELSYEHIKNLTIEDLLAILTNFRINNIPLIEYDNSINQIVMLNFHMNVWVIFNEVRVMRKTTRKTIKVPVTYSPEEIDNMTKEELETFVNGSKYPLGVKITNIEMNNMPFDLYKARIILREKIKTERFSKNLDEKLKSGEPLNFYSRSIGIVLGKDD